MHSRNVVTALTLSVFTAASASVAILSSFRSGTGEDLPIAVSGPEALRRELRAAQAESLPSAIPLTVDAGWRVYTGDEGGNAAALAGGLLPAESPDGGTGNQKSAKPKPKARGDRDFKATPQEWSEERYPATQRQHYLTAFGGLAFEWDARNRLVYAAGGGIDLYGLYECGYDVQGRLVYKDAPHGGDYLWDGWRMVKKQEWLGLDFGETVEYVWGKDLSGTMEGAGGVGGLLAVRVDGAWHFPLYDHNGSIVAYVDSTGAVSAEYEYDPFGKVIAHTGRDFDFQFSTKFYDPDIDMYYYGYRYYSPELRRWASRDPIGEEGGLNLYGFCGNDGVNGIDVLGMISPTLQPVGHSPTGDNNHFWIGVFFNNVDNNQLISAVKAIHLNVRDCITDELLKNTNMDWNDETVLISAEAKKLISKTGHNDQSDIDLKPYMVAINLTYPGREKCRKGTIDFKGYFFIGEKAPELPKAIRMGILTPSLFGYGTGSDLSHNARGSRAKQILPADYDTSRAFASLSVKLTFTCGEIRPTYDIKADGSWLMSFEEFRRDTLLRVRDKEALSLNATWLFEGDYY